MKKILLIFILLLSFVPVIHGKQRYRALLDSVFAVADKQIKKAWHYESEFYYKEFSNLKRKNLAIHFYNNSSYYEDGGHVLFSEAAGTMEHTNSDHFAYKVKYRYDAVHGCDNFLDGVMMFFKLTIYRRYMLHNMLLSPVNGKNAKYYKYTLDNVAYGLAHITFRPRVHNSQMVKGFFLYDLHNRNVTRICFSGDDGIEKFTCDVTMGEKGEERYWPVKNNLTIRYHYYGNIIDGRCTLCQRYTTITSHYANPVSSYGKYDMTYLYALNQDTTQTIIDSLQIAKRRMVPLTEREETIYEEKYSQYRNDDIVDSVVQRDSNRVDGLRKNLLSKKWVRTVGDAGEIFFNHFDFQLSKHSDFNFSPLNANYSGWRGITLREDMEYSYSTDGGRRFAIVPSIGYNFKPNQLVGKLRFEYNYLPMHVAYFSLEGGTYGIQNSTSRIHSLITGQPLQPDNNAQSILFDDRYVEFQHTIELFNGFSLLTGVVYRDRVPSQISEEERLQLGMEKRYSSFAPHICLTYTPCQRFFFQDKRKILLQSRYPTFCLDYERAFRGALNCENQYEKWEAMVTQSFSLNPIMQLMWKFGAGMFTDMKDVNFVDYRYFSNGITDYNWQDEWGGVFQLLDGKYYYDSPHYFRGHIVLQSPDIILGRIGTRFVRAERVYVNGLMTEGLAPYIEAGYGVSLRLFDISFFASYIKSEAIKTGLKFSLHLE